MKYVKRLLVLLLVVWAVLVPFANGAGPESLLYALKIKVNDPIFAFFQITAEGRGESYIKQFDRSMEEYVEAVYRRQSNAENIAREGVYIAWNRVRRHSTSSMKAGNYKVADAVRADVLGLLVGHRRVLETMVSQVAVPRSLSDFDFLEELQTVAEKDRREVADKFATAYEKAQLVRGIDGRIKHVEAKEIELKVLLTEKSSVWQQEAKLRYDEKMQNLVSYLGDASSGIANDNYVLAYIGADNAEAVYFELQTILKSAIKYSLPIHPVFYDYNAKRF